MNFPEWTKPAVYGAVVGAIATTIVGFGWGGWTSAATAQKMANNQAKSEVTMAMVPVCLDLSSADPAREAKMVTIRDASSFNKSKEVMKTGWATLPGTDSPNRELAKACLEGLERDDS